jgi:hypothetical protein
MAIWLRKIQRENPHDRAQAKWYLTQEKSGNVGLKDIAKEIERRSALSLGDVQNVLSNMVEVLPVFLKLEGRKILFEIVVFVFVAIVMTFSSCDEVLPVNYDKAGRDLMAIMRQDASLTISEYKSIFNESGMSSKDMFTLLKTDGSISKLTQLFSLDLVNSRMKEFGVDVKNLKRALEE